MNRRKLLKGLTLTGIVAALFGTGKATEQNFTTLRLGDFKHPIIQGNVMRLGPRRMATEYNGVIYEYIGYANRIKFEPSEDGKRFTFTEVLPGELTK